MPRRSDSAPILSLEKLITGLPTADYQLNVTLVYQDSQSNKWAAEIYQKVETLLGGKTVRGTWWNIADLVEPGVLAGAVSKAMRSDMIIVAASASEGLPLPFYYWVNAWLPNRVASPGALVGLVGAPVPHTPESGRLRKYLRTVARRARMDLILAERFAIASSQPAGFEVSTSA